MLSPCPAGVHLSPPPGDSTGLPLASKHGEAARRNGGILFVGKQATVAEGLRERANRSPCAGLITASATLAAVPSLLGGAGGTHKKSLSVTAAFLFRAFWLCCFFAVRFCHFFFVGLFFFFFLQFLACFSPLSVWLKGAAPSEGSGGSPQVAVEEHRPAPALRTHEAVVCVQRLGPDAVRVCGRDAVHACMI